GNHCQHYQRCSSSREEGKQEKERSTKTKGQEVMTDKPRLIEVAFPLKQASLASVHEKNVRHGHISTLHIWPARRPLAACRAALLATLLPDPGDPAKRAEIRNEIGGKVTSKYVTKRDGAGRQVAGQVD